METRELRKKTESELTRVLHDERDKLRQLRFDLASGRVKNIRVLRETRSTIARLLTVQREKKTPAKI